MSIRHVLRRASLMAAALTLAAMALTPTAVGAQEPATDDPPPIDDPTDDGPPEVDDPPPVVLDDPTPPTGEPGQPGEPDEPGAPDQPGEDDQREDPAEPGAPDEAGEPDEPGEAAEPGREAEADGLPEILLSSRPQAAATIHLDFDGHRTSGTRWNDDGPDPIVSAPFDIDGDRERWSPVELAVISHTWAVVAEDFAPFEVNVTTAEPAPGDLSLDGPDDERWGIRVVVTDDDWSGCRCRGQALVGSFLGSSDAPAFVHDLAFPGLAHAISEQVGRSLGLAGASLDPGTATGPDEAGPDPNPGSNSDSDSDSGTGTGTGTDETDLGRAGPGETDPDAADSDETDPPELPTSADEVSELIEAGPGGLLDGFPPTSGGLVVDLDSGQTFIYGSVVGDRAAIEAADGQVQELTETLSGGAASARHDRLDHRWVFPAAVGNQELRVVATASPDAGDDDDGFAVEWSTNRVDWERLIVIPSGQSVDQTFPLGGPDGEIHVRVVDTDRTPRQQRADTISIDLVEVTGDGLPVEPLPDPTEAVAEIGFHYQGLGEGRRAVVVTAEVTDDRGDPVSGAEVEVEVGGDVTETVTITTGADGTGSAQTEGSAVRPDVDICLADVATEDLSWSPGAATCPSAGRQDGEPSSIDASDPPTDDDGDDAAAPGRPA